MKSKFFDFAAYMLGLVVLLLHANQPVTGGDLAAFLVCLVAISPYLVKNAILVARAE